MYTDLKAIPEVGEKIKMNLINMGFLFIEDLAGQDPLDLYDRERKFCGKKPDITQLYAYKVAVSYAKQLVQNDLLLA